MAAAQATEVMAVRPGSSGDETAKTKTRAEAEAEVVRWIEERWLTEARSLLK